MVALLREFPDVQITFNLVPSLLVQLEAFAANRARDRYLELGLKPAAELTPDDAAFILAELLSRAAAADDRRRIRGTPNCWRAAARRPPPATRMRRRGASAADDLRDLQVWQKLAWIDPFYLDGDARVRGAGRQGPRLHRRGQGMSCAASSSSC